MNWKFVMLDDLIVEGNVIRYSGDAAALSRSYLEQVNSIEQFVSFDLSRGNGGQATIKGDLGGFSQSLSSLIGVPVGAGFLSALVRSICMLLETCAQNGMLLKCIALRGDVIFYNARDNEFKFIYLPFTDIKPQNDSQLAFFKGFGNMLTSKDEATKRALEEMKAKLETVRNYNPATLLRIYKETSANLSAALKKESATTLIPTSPRIGPLTGVLDPVSPEEAAKLSDAKADSANPIAKHAKNTPQPEKDPAVDSSEVPGTTVLNGIGGVNEVLEKEAADQSKTDGGVNAPSESTRHLKRQKSEEPRKTKQMVKRRLFLTRERTNERFEVSGDDFIVGKSMNASFQVYDTTTVSRKHARFTVREDGCWISDLNSKNGSFIEGVRMQRGATKQLHHGDIVQLSDERFRVEIEDAQKSRAWGRGQA